jgi:iron complex outermembrane receptor protein
LAARYVDELPVQGIPHYITMDVRLAWTPRENLELALVGRNLLDRYHPEYGRDTFNFLPSEVCREVFAKVTWQY